LDSSAFPDWWILFSCKRVAIWFYLSFSCSIKLFDLDNELAWFLKSFSRLLILDSSSLIFLFLSARVDYKLEILKFWLPISLSNLFNLLIYYLAFLNYRSWSWFEADLVFSWFSSNYKFLICLSYYDFALDWSPSMLTAFLSISRSLVIYLSLLASFCSSYRILILFSLAPVCWRSSCLIISCNSAMIASLLLNSAYNSGTIMFLHFDISANALLSSLWLIS